MRGDYVGNERRALMVGMNRQDIERIGVGQTGLYPWNKDLPVCEVGQVREIAAGPKAGKVFRYIQVQAPKATIGFIVAEDDEVPMSSRQAFKEAI
jgi:hypothetical protein